MIGTTSLIHWQLKDFCLETLERTKHLSIRYQKSELVEHRYLLLLLCYCKEKRKRCPSSAFSDYEN